MFPAQALAEAMVRKGWRVTLRPMRAARGMPAAFPTRCR
jgi:hypothetical protein